MLVELPVRQAALGDEAALEIAVLVVDELLQVLVSGLLRLLLLRLDLLGSRRKGVERIAQGGKIEVPGRASCLDRGFERFEIYFQLLCVVREVKRDKIARG